MTRASVYRAAAADLRRSGDDLTDLALLHRRFDAGSIGAIGPIATIHDDAVDATGGHLAPASSELERLAGECDRRADVCDDYQRRLRDWFDLPWVERLLTPPPLPPAAWVSG